MTAPSTRGKNTYRGEVERGGSELCGDDRFRYYLQEKP
jgi:hypothetical protein